MIKKFAKIIVIVCFINLGLSIPRGIPVIRKAASDVFCKFPTLAWTWDILRIPTTCKEIIHKRITYGAPIQADYRRRGELVKEYYKNLKEEDRHRMWHGDFTIFWQWEEDGVCYAFNQYWDVWIW